MNRTRFPEGLWLMCRWQLMSLQASWKPEIKHTGPRLEKCHWCTMTYIWCNELHYLFTHSSSSLAFKMLWGSWISFCTKGFPELLCLMVSSQCLPVVIMWWGLMYSIAFSVCSGAWRLQQWFSLHRAITVFSTMKSVHSRKNPISLFMESGPVCRVPCSELDYCWWSQGLSPAIW